MKSIQDLVYQIADKDTPDPIRHGLITLTVDEMQRFHDAAIAQYREGRLAGVSEPVALSDEQISLMAHTIDDGDWNSLHYKECWHKGFMEGARAAESAHGIGEALEAALTAKHEQMYTADQLAAAVLRERERCAQICDEYAKNSSNPMNFAENCAAAIRKTK